MRPALNEARLTEHLSPSLIRHLGSMRTGRTANLRAVALAGVALTSRRWAMTEPDPRKTQAWRKLSARVAREEPVCWLRLAGCTYWSTEGDHVLPVDTHPHLCLVRSNVRGSCRHCNAKRGNAPAPSAATRRPDALDIFD